MEDYTEILTEYFGAKPEGIQLLYFWDEACTICTALRPKVENLLLEQFDKVRFHALSAQKNLRLIGQMRMMSVPGILLLINGREFFRANGLVRIKDLSLQIERAAQYWEYQSE